MGNFRRGFVEPLLLALVAVLVIGCGAYLYFQDRPANQPVVVAPITQKPSTPSSQGQSLYTSIDDHFSISIPKNWRIEIDTTLQRYNLIYKNFNPQSPDFFFQVNSYECAESTHGSQCSLDLSAIKASYMGTAEIEQVNGVTGLVIRDQNIVSNIILQRTDKTFVRFYCQNYSSYPDQEVLSIIENACRAVAFSFTDIP